MEEETEPKKLNRSSRRELALLAVTLFTWLFPSYLLFTGLWKLDPKGNLGVALLIGWAFSMTTISRTSRVFSELRKLLERLGLSRGP